MQAVEFVQLLEERNLAPAGVIAQIRRQLNAAATPISVSAVAKALIDKQLLSPLLAQQLIDEVQAHAVAAAPVAAPSKSPTVSKPKPSTDDDIGLADFGDSPSQPAAVSKKPEAKAVPAKNPTTTNLPTAKTVPVKAPAPAPRTTTKPAAPKSPATELDLASSGLDDLFSTGSSAGSLADLSSNDPLTGFGGLGSDPLLSQSTAAPVTASTRTRSANQNRLFWWGGIAAGVLFLLAALALVLLRDNGDQAWSVIKQSWTENPADTKPQLEQFVERFPGHSQVSTATVYLGLLQCTAIQKSGTNLREQAVQLAKVIAPLVDEPALTEAHATLAKLLPDQVQALIELARKVDLKNSTGRAELARLADQLLTLAEDSRVVPFEKRSQRRYDELREEVAQLQREEARRVAWENAQSQLAGPTAKAKLLSLLEQYPELTTLPAWQAAAQRAGIVSGGSK